MWGFATKKPAPFQSLEKASYIISAPRYLIKPRTAPLQPALSSKEFTGADLKLASKLFSLLSPTDRGRHVWDTALSMLLQTCSLHPAVFLCAARHEGLRSPERKDEMFRKGFFPRTAIAEGSCPCPQVFGHCQRLRIAGKSQGPSDPQQAGSPGCQGVKEPS